MTYRTAISRAFLYILIGVMVYLSVGADTSAQRRRRGAPVGSPTGTPIGGALTESFSARDLDSQALSDLRLFRVDLAALRVDPKLRGQDDVLAARGFSLVQLCGEWNAVGRLKTGQGTSKTTLVVVQQQLEREVIAELRRYSRLASALQIEADDDVPLPRIDKDGTNYHDTEDLERVFDLVRGALEESSGSNVTASLSGILGSDASLAEELRAAIKEWPEKVGNDEALGEASNDVPEQELRMTLAEKLLALDQKVIQIRLQASRLSAEVSSEGSDNSERPPTQTEQLFGPVTEERAPKDVEGEAAEPDAPREPLSREELPAEMLELRKSLLTANLLARSVRKAVKADWPYAPVEKAPLEAPKPSVKREPRTSMLPLVSLIILAAVAVGAVIWSVSRK